MIYKSDKNRKKVNFMVNNELLAEIRVFIPEGERSNFVNEAISQALLDYKRKKALDQIETYRLESNLYMTDEEIIEARNYGRK